MKAIIIILSIVGSLLTLILASTIIYDFFIPDPCYYHDREPSLLFKLFYSRPGSENGHPVPSIFNYLLAGSFGYFIVFYALNGIIKIDRRNKKRAAKTDYPYSTDDKTETNI